MRTRTRPDGYRGTTAPRLITIADGLRVAVARLTFNPPVEYVYNPLDYARKGYEAYALRYGSSPREVVLLGMNPGPWGMAQTGVPFGEIHVVRYWLGIDVPIGKPKREHPKRPVEGFACRRSEVSGRRLWGWARDTFGKPDRFFKRFFVANYCPLSFMEASGRNITPDKFRPLEREPLFAVCDDALRETVEHFDARFVIGIGAFAANRARIALADFDVRIGQILHPSPASPAANRDWSGQATRQLSDFLGERSALS
jgi:single-strand selective monofunctional uracil DNA glycosylase